LFVLSDFIDEGYEDLLRAAALKHDLVVLHTLDQQEIQLPSMGIIPIYDPERKRTTWVNTSTRGFKNLLQQQVKNRGVELKEMCKKWHADYVELRSGEDFVPALVKLFNARR
jgi:hypothetical protein